MNFDEAFADLKSCAFVAPEPPFEPAGGCRVVGRDPSALDFVLCWMPVQDASIFEPLSASALKG